MALQDTAGSPDGAQRNPGWPTPHSASLHAGYEAAPSPTAAAKPSRRLPVHKDWPAWAIVTTQIGILVGAIVLPYIICFESLPKLALAPLVILVFGLGLASKIAIATALTLVVSTLTTYAGVKALDADGERLFYSLGASRLQVFRKLVVPFCLPWGL